MGYYGYRKYNRGRYNQAAEERREEDKKQKEHNEEHDRFMAEIRAKTGGLIADDVNKKNHEEYMQVLNIARARRDEWKVVFTHRNTKTEDPWAHIFYLPGFGYIIDGGLGLLLYVEV